MPNSSLRFAAIFCLGIALWRRADAAENPRFNVEQWTTKSSALPQNEVRALLQTRDGYLWVGTLDGLARFDGAQFTVFDKDSTPNLSDNGIIQLFEDSRSNLWIGTHNGSILLVKDGQLKNLGIGPGTWEGRLISACEDSTGAVWLCTADGHLARYRNGKVDVWQMGASTERGSVCRSLIAENGGLIWLGMDLPPNSNSPAAQFRLYGIDPKADLGPHDLPVSQALNLPGRLDLLLASKKGGYWRLSSGYVQKWNGTRREGQVWRFPWTSKPAFTACEDLEGNLIVGTLGDGVWWFDAMGNATHLEGLSHDYILSLVMDREGNLWVGTDGGGLDRVKRQPFSVLTGTEAITVLSACENKDGGLWLNTKDGVRFANGGELKSFGPEQGLQNKNGQSIFVDGSQMVWAGFGSPGPGGQWTPGLLQLKDDHFEIADGYSPAYNQEISAIFQDRAGRMWVGTQRGLACRDGQNWKVYGSREGLSSDAVQAIAEDAEGNIWAGSSAGLNVLRDGHFISFHKKDGLPDENISSLYADGEGVLWIGTRGGLGRYAHGKWSRFTKQQGLLSNSVGYVLEDAEGDLWIGSFRGLMRVQKKELNDMAAGRTNHFACRGYGVVDGMADGECTIGFQPGACRGHDGKLWFPTIKGIAYVDPAQLKINTNPPPVVIESVAIGGEKAGDDPSTVTNALRAELPGTITVPPGRERVTIQFTGLSLSSGIKERFRYRMEGYEKDWTELDGNIRTVQYPNLPPGHYLFRVIACNEDQVWNEAGATLAFVVQPPFWRTRWFISLMTLAVLGCLVEVVHYFSTQKLQRQLEGMRQQQALEKERARIARDIHDQLGASMTQVSLLGEMVESDKGDPVEVEAHARQISQTARDTSRVLDEIVWTVNPSNDTLEGLMNYICKYAQEYFAVAGLRYRLDVPAQLPDADISPEVRHNVFLAAKEAVTNVVRHAKATEVWLRLRLEPGRFILELQDNGRGPSGLEGKSTRNGLRNMHKRMEDVGGSFALARAPEGGAIARLIVPIKTH